MIIILILLFSFSLLVGIVLSDSLSKGVMSLSNRLGADVMIVPEGYESRIDSILLSGKPTNFYLPADAVDKIKNINGIDKYTTQTFLATLSASCCSYPVQLIGIDYETDFIVKPWLEETMNMKLKENEVIVGARVEGEPGQVIKFFEQPYKIAGRLEQTGMSFDASVFMTKETIAKLAVEAERIMDHPLSEDGSLISTVMIKLKSGYDSVEVSREITSKYAKEGIYAMHSKKFVNKISSNLIVVSNYIKFIIIIMLVLSVLVIALVFSLTLNERKKELGVLRVIGATKKKIISIILRESLIVSLFGSAIGTIIGIVTIFAFSPIVKESLNLPFVIPSFSKLVIYGIICLLISTLTGVFASAISTFKIVNKEIYSNVKEGL